MFVSKLLESQKSKNYLLFVCFFDGVDNQIDQQSFVPAKITPNILHMYLRNCNVTGTK